MIVIPSGPFSGAQSRRDVRDISTAVLLLVSLVLATFFYGLGVNLEVLWIGVLALLLAALVSKPDDLFRGWMAGSIWGWGLPLLVLVWLVIGYQFTLSPDSSYPVTWVLAAGPMAFLIARGNRASGWIVMGMRIWVAMLAGVSAARFFWLGERAYAPFNDPNIYATLLYVVLIPCMFEYLSIAWRLREGRGQWLRLCFVGVVTLALFATLSRSGAAIVLGALTIFMGVALLKRLALLPWVVLASTALLGFALVWLASGEAGSAAAGETLASGIGARTALIGSALAMFGERPLVGVGVFVFPLLYPSRRFLSEQSSNGMFVHNDYVQFLAEGGVLLAGCLVAFLVVTIVCSLRAVVSPTNGERFLRLGYLTALGAVLCHAMVNYLFYAFALCVAVGLTAALAWPVAAEREQGSTHVRIGMNTLLALAFLAWGYLGVDVYINGVYQGSGRLPMAAAIRGDPERFRSFTDSVRVLNARRALPTLGDAVIRARELGERPTDAALERTLDAYRQAVSRDALNSAVYVEMYRFVSDRPELASQLREEESPEALLLKSVGLSPGYVPGIDLSVRTMLAAGDEARALEFLEQRVVPWLELIWRQSPTAYERLLEDMGQLVRRHPDSGLACALERERERVEGLFLHRRKVWFR